jgi:hypothetical protein
MINDDIIRYAYDYMRIYDLHFESVNGIYKYIISNEFTPKIYFI